MWSKRIIIKCFFAQVLILLIALLNEYFINATQSKGFDLEFNSPLEKLLVIGLIGPFVETMIFNIGINEILLNWMKSKTIVIIISSALFSLSHSYSLVYVFFTFLSGLVFNSLYFEVRDSKQWWHAGLVVFIIHSIHNILGLILGK